MINIHDNQKPKKSIYFQDNLVYDFIKIFQEQNVELKLKAKKSIKNLFVNKMYNKKFVVNNSENSINKLPNSTIDDFILKIMLLYTTFRVIIAIGPIQVRQVDY